MRIIITAISSIFLCLSITVSAKSNEGKRIALAFSGGPVPGATESLLKQLETLQIPATFFLVGKEMERFPKQTRSIINAGHQLGNHGYSYIDLASLPLSSAKAEIKKTCKLLQHHGYQERPTILPPFGSLSEELGSLLAAQNFQVAQWDLEPHLHVDMNNPDAIADYIVQNAKDGSVVMLHPMYEHGKEVAEALPLIYTQVTEQGFYFVSLAQITDTGSVGNL
ncbi:polysaccharide deacetylase family protein [Microbulbifer sp. CnH-101-G]|uniref:polysaccharide deacetylase family protein n=1 Tax=Microbulbifer sp. CnH-101-G TaxID=3243393 RepID=UPI004039FDE4